jgi:hypothetical protein
LGAERRVFHPGAGMVEEACREPRSPHNKS